MRARDPAILYIEDHPASQRVFEVLMKDVMGYVNLTILEDSSNLIPRLEATGVSFDLIFLDLNIEPVHGNEVLLLLRQHSTFRNAKIVALTASIGSDELEKLHVSGFDGMISKPLGFETFPQFVSQIIAGQSVWEAGR